MDTLPIGKLVIFKNKKGDLSVGRTYGPHSHKTHVKLFVAWVDVDLLIEFLDAQSE